MALADGRASIRNEPGEPPKGAVPQAEPFARVSADALIKGEDALFKKPFRPARWNIRLVWPLVSIALPTLVSAVYFLFIASGQYVSEFRAIIKPADPSVLENGAPALGGNVVSGLIALQSNVVVQYIKSANLVAAMDQSLHLRDMYSSNRADILARLDPTASREKLVRYWGGKVSPFFDTTTGAISVQVKAFAPEDARKIALGVIAASEQLVNDMARRSQADAVRSANEEVSQAQNRLRKARQDMLEFQNGQRSISPKEEVTNGLGQINKLEEQRGMAQAELNLYRDTQDAPAAFVLRSRIASINAQIATLSAGMTATGTAEGDTSLSQRLGSFQALDTEREMAERYYDTALRALERARYDASRQTAFLEVFVQPTVSQDAAYPKRFENILLTFLAGCGLWLLGIVVYQSVRDHV